MTILVLTQWRDATADLVINELNDRGAEVVRLDTADFPQRTTMAAGIASGRGWSGIIRTPHRVVDVAEVSAVYCRRPGKFDMPSSMSDIERRWALDEARHGFGGVLAAADAVWINHPSRNARAAYKPYQLSTASRCGLAIPRTLITNDPDEAAAFIRTCPDGGVYKTLDGTPELAGWTHWTTPVTAEQVAAPSVAATAHLFQERVPKAYEIRLTVVGDAMFAARIDAHSEATRRDWRANYGDLTFTATEIAPTTRQAVKALMTALDLRYGAIDLVVTPDDRVVFLEINSNGQFGFAQQRADLPIAAAIADELTAADLTHGGIPA